MQTQQFWLVAHLSGEHVVERVEAVVGISKVMYIADHPKRCLMLNVDLWGTFDEARDASVRYIDAKIYNLGLMREAAANQQNPHPNDPDHQNLNTQRQTAQEAKTH